MPVIAAAGIAIVSSVYASTPAQRNARAKNASFDTITVKRINVVENDGTRRMVISGATNPAPLIINGKLGKRAIKPAGITFYNRDGNERGGIGLARHHGGEQRALIFDNRRAEAIAFVSAQNKHHTYSGLVVMDPPAPGADFGDGKPRVKVLAKDGIAKILLKDANGRTRLRLTVSKRGKPAIEFLNSKGKVTRTISSNAGTSG